MSSPNKSKPLKLTSKTTLDSLTFSNYKMPFHIPRKTRWFVFVNLIFLCITQGLDQGTISGCTNEIIKDIEMSDIELGGFGGMVFLGTAFGCLFSFSAINKFNRKCLVVVTVGMDVLSLTFITFTKNITLLYISRVITGFSTSFISVYLPVWSDQFGIHRKKSIMMSIIHISSSLGYLLGYIIGSLIGWKLTFYVQTAIIFGQLLIIYLGIQEIYFSSNIIAVKDEEKRRWENDDGGSDKENKGNKGNKDNNDNNDTSKGRHINKPASAKENTSSFSDYKRVNDNSSSDLVEKLLEKKENFALISSLTIVENERNADEFEGECKDKLIDDDALSMFEDIENRLNKKLRDISLLKHCNILIKSPLFILINVLLISMFIIISGVQFWISDYMEKVLNEKESSNRLYAFATLVTTAPMFGIYLGGIISTKIGGYDKENAIYIPLFSSLMVVVLANVVPIADNLLIFCIIFWFFLFFGSVILPVANGIALCSVDKEYTGSASSIITLLYNILGRSVGPNFYALFKNVFDNEKSKVPFWILLNVSIIGLIACFISLKFNKQKYQNNK